MCKLFDDTERTFFGPSFHNEKSYDYYQRSARKDINIVREKLNEWFDDYQDSEKNELKKRFIKDFDSSFYELFLFTLFKNLGFTVNIHPTLQNTNKKPDFLIQKDNIEIYVEAKVVYDKSKEQMAYERKVNEIYDQLDKIICPGFLLHLDTLLLKTTKQPSTRKAIKHIQEEISKLDSESVTENLYSKGFEGIPVIEFENNDIHIIVKPIPTIKSAKEIEDKRALGMFPFESFWGGNENALKSSINEKA